MDLGLKNKTVVVTGGASGLGAAISAVFHAEGANVVVFDLTKKDSLVSDDEYLNIIGDVTNSKDIDQAISSAVEKYGGVDVLVNNAGIW